MLIKKSDRYVSIDICKGFLVLLMILYHCSSIIPANNINKQYAEIITYNISFISRYFLFLSGLICGIHYASSYTNKFINNRLIIRGIKLLIIFFTANILIYILQAFDLSNVFLITKEDISIKFFNIVRLSGDIYSFTILFYIGIFLILSSILLNYIYIIFLIFSLCLLLNPKNSLILTMTYGFFGIIIGHFYKREYFSYILNKIDYIYKISFILIIVLLFIKNYYNPFNILFEYKRFILLDIIINTISISIYTFSFLYILNKYQIWKPYIIIFGKYSLLSYLLQMIIIRFNFKIIFYFNFNFTTYYLINVIFTTVFLYVILYLINNSRNKSQENIISKIYNLIFN